MNSTEDCEMLQLCEPDADDLKVPEIAKIESTENVTPECPPPIVKSSSSDISVEMKALYSSLKMDLSDPRQLTLFRLDTLHMQGVDDFSTQDIYKFFQPLKPLSLEWINDTSCNVIWSDEPSAAQALIQVSLPDDDVKSLEMEPSSKDTESTDKNVSVADSEIDKSKESNEIVMGDEEDEGSEDGELVDDEPVKQLVWRLKVTDEGTKLKFRFATWDDKKVRGAEKHSEYYKKYGNPNFGGMKGLISNSRKRKMREQRDGDKSRSNSPNPDYPDSDLGLEDARLRISQIAAEKAEQKEPNVKRPKMKMYADEEEQKTQKQKFTSVSNRLGNIMVNFSLERETEYDDLEISSPKEFGSKSVWDRLQVEVPNARFSSSSEERKSHRSHRSRPSPRSDRSQRDLRKKLQMIRDDKKKEHRSPMLMYNSE